VTFGGSVTSRHYFGVQLCPGDLHGCPIDLVTYKALRPELYLHIEQVSMISQEKLAHIIGGSFATVNHWENGTTIPSKLAKRPFEQFHELKREQYSAPQNLDS
jgi:putative transcriptional regulator